MPKFQLSVLAAAALAAHLPATAVTFETESVSGSFDSTVSVGTGIRARKPASSLVLSGASGSGAPVGELSPTSALGDQGTLNYDRGDAFTTYLKGSHELLLKLPGEVRFMARASWLKDFTATHTAGWTSATTPPGLQDNLAPDARKDLGFKARMLDLWVSKTFSVGDQQPRVRVGNQVINWGESLFIPGGINSTNAIDINRLSSPGTQLKEAILPAPMVSVASGLGRGFNAEAYVQTRWNANYFPPTGGYWSVVNGLGRGHDTYGLAEVSPRKGGQWGAALRFQPEGTQVNLGVYALNYHDKGPNFSTNINGTGAVGWAYAQDRRLYGISANLPLGDWAVGTELSYRPRDAVALNAATSGCASQNGNCWVDQKRLQWHVTGLLSLTPSNAKGVLDFLRADTATFMAEAVAIRYPQLKPAYGGDLVSAGGWGWGQETSAAGAPVAVGTRNSSGINFDFSWVYDGTLLPGWQVVPEVYYFQALNGRTPNVAGTFMKGAKSVNLIVSFIKNPATWQFGFNYAVFRGGSSVFDQPLRDRDFVGAYLSRNF